MPLGDWMSNDVYGARAVGPSAPAVYGRGNAGMGNDMLGAQARSAASATIDPNSFGQANAQADAVTSREAQGDSVGMLRDAAMGNTPSAAEIQMRSGLDSAMNSQYALAHSAQGNGSAMAAAQRQAMFGAAGIQQAGVHQQAALRAQEMATARGQYAQAAMQQRAQDLQRLGMSQAQALAQAQLEQQQHGINAQTGLGYASLSNAANQAQLGADMQQQALQSGAQNLQAQLSQQAGSGALSGMLGLAGTVGGAMLGGPAGAAVGGYAGSAIGGAVSSPSSSSGSAGNAAGGAAADAGSAGNAAGGAAADAGGSGASNAGAYFGSSDARNKTDVHDEGGASPSLMDMFKPHVAQLETPIGHEVKKSVYPGSFVNTAKYRQYKPDVVTSDAREKQDARPGANEVERFLSELRPVSYNYKPGIGEDPSARRFGVMAQDVEKTPMGASFVVESPHGKQLDIKHGFGAQLAALGNLHERVTQLERGSTLGPRGRRGGQ